MMPQAGQAPTLFDLIDAEPCAAQRFRASVGRIEPEGVEGAEDARQQPDAQAERFPPLPRLKGLEQPGERPLPPLSDASQLPDLPEELIAELRALLAQALVQDYLAGETALKAEDGDPPLGDASRKEGAR